MSGLTLRNHVYLTADLCPIDPANRSTVETVFHELVHVVQFRRNAFLFPIRYLLDHIRYGYANNPAEIEAREFAAELSDHYFRDRLVLDSANTENGFPMPAPLGEA